MLVESSYRVKIKKQIFFTENIYFRKKLNIYIRIKVYCNWISVAACGNPFFLMSLLQLTGLYLHRPIFLSILILFEIEPVDWPVNHKHDHNDTIQF